MSKKLAHTTSILAGLGLATFLVYIYLFFTSTPSNYLSSVSVLLLAYILSVLAFWFLLCDIRKKRELLPRILWWLGMLASMLPVWLIVLLFQHGFNLDRDMVLPAIVSIGALIVQFIFLLVGLAKEIYNKKRGDKTQCSGCIVAYALLLVSTGSVLAYVWISVQLAAKVSAGPYFI